MQLRPYQRLIEAHILEHARNNCFVPMGLGKTASTLSALSKLAMVESGPTLVLAPKRVAQSTWPDEVEKWGFDLPVSPIIGNGPERVKALKRDAAIYTMNYDNLPWLVMHLGHEWPFRRVIADESTKLKGFRTRQGGVRAGALKKIAHSQVNAWVNLTGTPAPNGVKDIWGPQWFVDMGKRLGNSFTAFSNRWFRPTYDGYGIEPLPGAQKEIQELIAGVTLSLDAGDWFDLREPIKNVIQVELPAKARKLYQDMEKQMFLDLESQTEVEAFNAAARTQKCLQLTNGAIYTDETGKFEEIHDAKIQALDSIIAESGGSPILVAYHFKSCLARLRRAFPSARVLDDSPATIRDWNRGHIPLLLAHPASAGHGLNLQDGGNTLVFFGVNWNLEEHAQIIERIGPTRQMQAGHDRPVFIHYILARDTVDQGVMESIETKRSVQDILMQAMKRR